MSLRTQHGSFQIPASSSAQIEVPCPGMEPQFVFFWWNGRDSAVDAAGEESHRFGFGWAAETVSDPETIVQRCVTVASLHGSDGGETDTYATSNRCIFTIEPGTDDPASLESGVTADSMGGEVFYVTPAAPFTAPLQVHYLAIGGGETPTLDGASDITNLAVGTIEISATGDLDVTDVGFQSDFLVFLSWGSEAEDQVIVGGNFGLGIAAGAGELEQCVCYGSSSDTAESEPTITSHAQQRGAVIVGNNDPYAILSAMLSNGFRLNVVSAQPSPTKHYYLAIKGGRFKVDELLTSDTVDTVLTLVSVGFPPKAGLFVSDTQSLTQDNFSISIGAASGDPVVQGAVLVQDKHATNPSEVLTAVDYANVYLNASDGSPQVINGKVAVTALGGDVVSLTQIDADSDPTPILCLLIGEQAASPFVDQYGYLRMGAPLIYVPAAGYEEAAYLDQPYAAIGDTVNLMVTRVVAGVLTCVAITGVLHVSAGSGPPYWTAVNVPAEGGDTAQAPILRMVP